MDKDIQDILDVCNEIGFCPLGYALHQKGFDDAMPDPFTAAHALDISNEDAIDIAGEWDEGDKIEAIKMAREIGIL